MKRLSADRKRWLAHHARSSLRRRILKLLPRDRESNSEGTTIVTGYRHGQKRPIMVAADPEPIPSVICFDSNYEETAEFVGRLSDRLCKAAVRTRARIGTPPSQRKWYDFARIDYISPSAALVLAAEYERAGIIANNPPYFTINMDDWKEGPKKIFFELGFLNLLGIDNQVEEPDGMKHIVRFRSDTKLRMELASSTLKEVIILAASASLLSIEDDLLKNFRTFLLAIGEALNNTSDHAYPPDLKTVLPHVGRWWITGAVDLAQRRMTFAVYDQGVSIPSAIPYGRRAELVRQFFRRWIGSDHDPENTDLDGRAIAAAVRGGVSGTGLEHRGRGLGLMRDCIRSERNGRLRIISRHGDFVACTGRKDEHHTRTSPLRGTLVEWTVNL